MVKIKCPVCGANLNVKEVPGLKDKSVRCPVCGESNPFAKYKEIVETSHDDTLYAGSPNYKHKGGDDATEIITKGKDDTIITKSAYLLDKATKKQYALQDGKNYVGRKATSTPAKVNVRIETTDNGFSRAHFSLEVVQTAGGVCKYKLSNDENKNPTFINGIKLENGDVCLLKENDVLKSSSVELQFLLK